MSSRAGARVFAGLPPDDRRRAPPPVVRASCRCRASAAFGARGARAGLDLWSRCGGGDAPPP
eukprot:4818848-Lingulodinium_polyedra.AAC.1